MGFRNKLHMYLPDGPNSGNGQPAGGDGGAGGAGAPPSGGNNGPQNDGGGSGTGGTGDGTPPGNGDGGNGAQGGGSGDVPIDQLPEGWQKHIRELRTENQTRRGNEQNLTADRDKYKGFYDSIHGVVNPSEQRDPAQLTQDVQNARTAQQESDRKLAIYQQAGSHGADPSALLDSDSFLRSVRDLDPSSQDFATQIGERIKTAVESNGRLKASQRQNNGNGNQQRPGSSGSTEFPGGAGGNQLTRDDLAKMKPEEIEKARSEGRLKLLLGG